MELRYLRYFVLLAETLNFTRAAERAHKTQSTLSRQIKKLEQQIGMPLFDRSGGRVRITQSGRAYLVPAQRALKEVDQGLSALRDSALMLSGSIRIGTIQTFNAQFIPSCVARFMARYPGVRVLIQELAAHDIDASLISGSLGMGIGFRPATRSRLRFEPLYSEALVLATSLNHPLASRRRIRMVELHEQPLVLLPPTFATRRILNDCFYACKIEPRVVAEMNATEAMLGLVERTRIGAIVSHDSIQSWRSVRIVPIESPTPTRTIGLLSQEDAVQETSVRAFSAIARAVARERERKHLALLVKTSRYRGYKAGSAIAVNS